MKSGLARLVVAGVILVAAHVGATAEDLSPKGLAKEELSFEFWQGRFRFPEPAPRGGKVFHGKASNVPDFAGRLVRLSDGKAVTDAQFWRGYSEASVYVGNLDPVKATIGRDGRYRIPTTIAVCTTVYDDGETTEWVEQVWYVIRRPGCKDYVVHFTTEWREGDLLLECEPSADVAP